MQHDEHVSLGLVTNPWQNSPRPPVDWPAPIRPGTLLDAMRVLNGCS